MVSLVKVAIRKPICHPNATAQSSPPCTNTGVSAIAIALGTGHTCALVTGGGLKCWGRNDAGQLGIGSTAQQNSPVAVDLGPGAGLSGGAEWMCQFVAGTAAAKQLALLLPSGPALFATITTVMMIYEEQHLDCAFCGAFPHHELNIWSARVCTSRRK
jgi:hypothetical protein